CCAKAGAARAHIMTRMETAPRDRLSVFIVFSFEDCSTVNSRDVVSSLTPICPHAVYVARREVDSPSLFSTFTTRSGLPRSHHVIPGRVETASGCGYASRTDREKFTVGASA